MSSSKEKIINLLKSKMQIIWIKSYEEERVINDLKDIIIKNFPKMEVKTWTFFNGLQKEPLVKSEEKEKPNPGISPDKLLSIIMDNQINKKNENLWVLKDFHLNIETKSIIRGLRDLKDTNRKNNNCYNPIVIVSPIVNIPIELDKLITVINYDVPDKDIIAKYMKQYIKLLEQKELEIPTQNEINRCINLAQGLTLNEFMNYCQRSIIENKTINSKIFFDARVELLKKTGILDYKTTVTKLDDIGGNNKFKEWIEDIKTCFEPEAEAFGVQKPKGFLAVGLPGTSKTMSAEVMSSTLNLPLLQFKMSSVMHSHVGQSEKNMESALDLVKKCSPCVLLIDEVEKTLSGM